MKNIRFYAAPKYSTPEYEEVESMICKTYVENTPSERALRLAQVTDEALLKEIEKITKWEKGTREDLDDDFLISEYEGQQYYRDPEDDEDTVFYDMDASGGTDLYVTSIVFEPEPEYDENEPTEDISQYPLEDILEKFYCLINDDYEEENTGDSAHCYIEFASEDMADIQGLLTIIGKHVYNKDNGDTIDLVIE